MKAAPMVASCASVVQETFEQVEINTLILRTHISYIQIYDPVATQRQA